MLLPESTKGQILSFVTEALQKAVIETGTASQRKTSRSPPSQNQPGVVRHTSSQQLDKFLFVCTQQQGKLTLPY